MLRGSKITVEGKEIIYGRAEHNESWNTTINRFILLN